MWLARLAQVLTDDCGRRLRMETSNQARLLASLRKKRSTNTFQTFHNCSAKRKGHFTTMVCGMLLSIFYEESERFTKRIHILFCFSMMYPLLFVCCSEKPKSQPSPGPTFRFAVSYFLCVLFLLVSLTFRLSFCGCQRSVRRSFLLFIPSLHSTWHTELVVCFILVVCSSFKQNIVLRLPMCGVLRRSREALCVCLVSFLWEQTRWYVLSWTMLSITMWGKGWERFEKLNATIWVLFCKRKHTFLACNMWFPPPTNRKWLPSTLISFPCRFVFPCFFVLFFSLFCSFVFLVFLVFPCFFFLVFFQKYTKQQWIYIYIQKLIVHIYLKKIYIYIFFFLGGGGGLWGVGCILVLVMGCQLRANQSLVLTQNLISLLHGSRTHACVCDCECIGSTPASAWALARTHACVCDCECIGSTPASLGLRFWLWVQHQHHAPSDCECIRILTSMWNQHLWCPSMAATMTWYCHARVCMLACKASLFFGKPLSRAVT